MKKHLLILLSLALLLFCGCARKSPAPLPEGEAAARWQAFAANASFTGSYDVLSGSLRFGPAEDTKRVTYSLVSEPSDIPADAEHPRRNERVILIEISASMAGSVGTLRFAEGGMTMILPKEGRIYVGSASDANLRKVLGLSLPLNVQALNDFLAGRLFSALDAPQPERYESQEGGSIVYRCRSEAGAFELALDEHALPVRLVQKGGWALDISYDERGLPSKISGRLDSVSGQQRLVLLVKERRPAPGVSPARFGMAIPAGFTVYSLD